MRCRIALLILICFTLEGGMARAQDRGWATAIAWSPDGATIAVGSSVGVWLFDTEFNEKGFVATPELKGNPPDSIDWNATGDMIAISFRNDDTPVLVLSAEHQRVITRINTQFPLSVRWRPKENVLATVSFFEVITWNALTSEMLIRIGRPEAERLNHLYALCWLNSDEIALLGNYNIFLVRVSDQTTLKTLGNLRGSAADCHDDDRMATAGGLVFDLDVGRRLGTDTQLATLDNYAFNYVSVAWSPDGSKIVANGNGGMCRFGVFDGETTEILAELQGSFSRVDDYLRYADSIAWHPDGSRFAVVGQFDIRLWDADTFALLKRYDGFAVPFYPASGDEDRDEAERLELLRRNHIKCPE